MKKILFIVVLLFTLGASARAEIEEELPFRFSYDLSRFRILTIAADKFSFEETVEISRLWQSMGAHVEFAGPKRCLTGEKLVATPSGGRQSEPAVLPVKLLLSRADAARYDLVYIAGGDGIREFVQEHGVALKALFAKALQGRTKIAAICHASLALSLADGVSGKRMTGNGESELNALRAVGAIVVDEEFVSDGAFLTGQYPFLRTFAVQIAEQLQFPEGNGPLRKFLSERTDLEKAFDDLRNSQEISGEKIAEETLEKIFRSAFKTVLMQPWGNFPPLFKVVRVSDPETREALALGVGAELKRQYLSAFGSEQRIDVIVGKCFRTPADVFLVFIDMNSLPPAASQLQEIYFRSAVTRYGSALENIALTARSLGLGIGLLGFPPFLRSAEKPVREILGIPESMAFIDMFLLGHPLRSNPPAIGKPVSAVMSEGRLERPEGAE